MAVGSFFKGEKKKKKKGQVIKIGSFAPVFVPPTIIKKGKDRF